jgi:hypothetical protein
MSGTAHRFEAVIEPTDRWLVWDKARDLPAEHAGLALFGLSRAQALMYCQMLNSPEFLELNLSAQAAPHGAQDAAFLTQK